MDIPLHNNWSDIQSYFSTLTSHEKGKFFEKYAKVLLKTDPRYNKNIINIWQFDDIPSEIRKLCHFSTVDHGIDLLVEDNINGFIGIQVKYRENQNTINWSKDKIANVFADGLLDNVGIISNVQAVDNHTLKHPKLKLLILEEDLLFTEKQVQLQIINELNGSKKVIKREKKHPFEWQNDILKKAVEYFQYYDRGQLILPCGTGKTLIALWIQELLKAQHILVTLPTLNLLKQFKDVWLINSDDDFTYLCVCSDKDLEGKDAIEIRLPEIDSSITNDPLKIRQFLETGSNKKIIFSTYQSIHKVSDGITNIDFIFDLIISDEAHRTAGFKDTQFSLVHDNNLFPSYNRLYMTATPRVASSNIKIRLGEDRKLLYDMSRNDIFGKEIHHMSFKEAIDEEMLSEYKIIVVGISDNNLAKEIEDRKLIQEQYSIDELSNNIALIKQFNEYPVTHCISFHSRVQKAKTFTSYQKKLMNDEIFISHVNGKQSTKERTNLLNEFRKSNKGLMTNARCLTEGIDIPKLDVVFFSDPKYSKVDIVQAVGRVLRKSPNKKFGYIVLPIYHTKTGDKRETQRMNAFKSVINVVKAMAEHDERLQLEIDSIKLSRGKITGNKISHLEYFTDSPIEFYDVAEKIKASLFLEIIESVHSSWNVMFYKLKNFLQINKKYPIKEENSRLYLWISAQRTAYSKNKLKFERFEKLEGINFVWNMRDENWDIYIEKLKKYIEQNNGKTPPQLRPKRLPQYYDSINRVWLNEKKEAEHKLGNWCMDLNIWKKKGKLSEDRIVQLRSIGFYFGRYEHKWMIQHDLLNKIINSSDYKEVIPDTSLNWLRLQLQSENLEDYQQEAVEKLKIQYDKLITRHDLKWDEQYESLVKFFNKYNRLPKANSDKRSKSYNKDTEEYKLAYWIMHNAKFIRDGTLSNERKEKLRLIYPEIGIRRRKRQKDWMYYYYEYINFKKNFNKEPSQKSQDELESKLGLWASMNKQKYHGTYFGGKYKLKSRQLELLEKIGFDFTMSHNLSEKEITERLEEILEWIKNGNQLARHTYGTWYYTIVSKKSKIRSKNILTVLNQIKPFVGKKGKNLSEKEAQNRLSQILDWIKNGKPIYKHKFGKWYYQITSKKSISHSKEIIELFEKIRNN